MKCHPLAAAAVAAVLSVSVGACGGGSDGETKASPSKATAPAAETSTPATPTTPPPPPVQPTGAYGVTYEIQNWEQYATDPAVLAWKQTLEAVGGSVNSGKVLGPVASGMSKRALRPYVQSFENAWKGKWTVPSLSKIRIESATPSGPSRTRVIVCEWSPSVNFYDKDVTPVGVSSDEDLAQWGKDTVDMRLKDGRWIIARFDIDGDCPGGPPA
jgi:hypothetical protein